MDLLVKGYNHSVMTLVASSIAGGVGFKDSEGAAMLLAIGGRIMMF